MNEVREVIEGPYRAIGYSLIIRNVPTRFSNQFSLTVVRYFEMGEQEKRSGAI
ncbi:MAG TPA: hypothetical protein VJ124_24505 [Pyrinomonadaceae bacterium]|nr:hypothetical protein [Pyrinomonadaceae bacterium]